MPGPHSKAIPPVVAGQGTIELTRVQDGYQDFLRSYTVLIDEVPVGKVRRGQTVHLKVPAGTRQLRLTIAWCSSLSVTAEFDAGKLISFTCAPGSQPSAITAVTAGANDYIAVWRTPEAAAIPARNRIDALTRFRLGIAFAFCGGALTLIGAGIWHLTGAAPGADNVVTGVSLAITVASMLAFRISRRRH
ncbi:hypothetical protein ACFVTC_20880 [Streptomyces sp. NPDC057950]|uniref:hypothetical protein n=1 Tax=Streptomyces sp. NPDC057950 TaxID=3346288 RepID=UPI0036E476FE